MTCQKSHKYCYISIVQIQSNSKYDLETNISEVIDLKNSTFKSQFEELRFENATLKNIIESFETKLTSLENNSIKMSTGIKSDMTFRLQVLFLISS